MAARILTQHNLLPDVDGTVIAAGPLVKEPHTVGYRTVLRRLPNGGFVVHDQVYPDVEATNPYPAQDYHCGSYCGENERRAFEIFIERLNRTLGHLTDEQDPAEQV